MAIVKVAGGQVVSGAEPSMDEKFERLGNQYIEQFTAFSPVGATSLGDHRFDDQLDEISETARAKRIRWMGGFVKQLDGIGPQDLSRGNQVDYFLLKHELDEQLWRLSELREWEWNPLIYTELAGKSIYGLMARDFAPLPKRLDCVAKRLVQFPRFLQQVRVTLKPELVPAVHAETAVSQNLGLIKTLVV